MSRISQDFINSVGYLYEEINVQQNDFLNEESEYYDAEASELVEDIISSICLSMIYEGYSASTVIGFLADSSEEDILEKYLAFDGNILSESAVDENYVEEQLELLENRLKAAASLGKAAFKTLFGKGPGYAATKLQGPRAPGLVDKAKVVISKATQKVKDVASKAKEALPKVAKGAATFGLGAAGGYMGAKMAGAGAPTSSNAPKPPSTSNTPAKPATPSKSTSSAPSSPSRGSKASSAATPAKPKSPAAAKSEWEKANPRLAQAEKLRQQGASREDINKVLYNKGTAASQGSGQSQMEKDAEELRRMTDRSKQRQGKLMGGPEGPGTIDTKSVEADIKAAQERQKKQMEQQKNAMTTKESYEPYDIVLDYLFDNGHVDSLEEAHYVMLEMDAEVIQGIVEQMSGGPTDSMGDASKPTWNKGQKLKDPRAQKIYDRMTGPNPVKLPPV